MRKILNDIVGNIASPEREAMTTEPTRKCGVVKKV
jgi:hypothetical protein